MAYVTCLHLAKQFFLNKICNDTTKREIHKSLMINYRQVGNRVYKTVDALNLSSQDLFVEYYFIKKEVKESLVNNFRNC